MDTTSKVTTKMIPTRKAPAKKKAQARKAKPCKAPAKKVMGRPTRYLKSFDAQVDQQALLSAMDKKMSTFFGVIEKTLGKWKQKHSDLLRSITRARARPQDPQCR